MCARTRAMGQDAATGGDATSGGCLKVLAIAVPILALAVFLVWKVSQASGRASEVSERVVAPYLERVRAGDYQQALDNHGSEAFRKRVSAAKLEAAYQGLVQRYGRFVSFKLYIAEEQHEIGAASIVRAKYTLKFEKADETVTYDIAGEGAAARIDAAYERLAGGTLRAAPR